MKIIKTKSIDNRIAELVLLDDGITVQIIYDNQIISSSGNNTWNNIKDDGWAQEAILELETSSFIKRSKTKALLEKVAAEYF